MKESSLKKLSVRATVPYIVLRRVIPTICEYQHLQFGDPGTRHRPNNPRKFKADRFTYLPSVLMIHKEVDRTKQMFWGSVVRHIFTLLHR